jgi:hypothetical protein
LITPSVCLEIGAVPDGTFLKRQGSTVIGQAIAPPAGGSLQYHAEDLATGSFAAPGWFEFYGTPPVELTTTGDYVISYYLEVAKTLNAIASTVQVRVSVLSTLLDSTPVSNVILGEISHLWPTATFGTLANDGGTFGDLFSDSGPLSYFVVQFKGQQNASLIGPGHLHSFHFEAQIDPDPGAVDPSIYARRKIVSVAPATPWGFPPPP